MTYIVPGNFKNRPFLLIDSVGIDKNENSFKFKSKLKKLTSTKMETYCCFTGLHIYQYAIEAFDGKCDWLGDNFDFKNIAHIEEIIKIFNLLYSKLDYQKQSIDKFGRLYFIDKNGVYYYNIDGNLNLSDMVKIPNNKFIVPDDYTNVPISINREFESNEELINFCKNEILNLNPYNGMDLKDKFSYIVFDECDKKLYNSMNNNDELVLSMVNGNYSELK